MGAPAKIDFGWIKQAWAFFTAQSGVWIGATGLYFVINLAIWVLLTIPTGRLTLFQSLYASLITHKQMLPVPAVNPYREFLLNQAATILTAGLGAVFTGGLYCMALQQRRGEPIDVFGLFSALPKGVALFLVGIIVPVVLGFLSSVRLWPQSHFSAASVGNLYLILSTLLNALLMFAPFLVLDTKANVIEAVVGSVRLLRGQLLRGVWFYVVASFVGGIGFILCGVGMLATYPVFLISVAIVYLALTRHDTDLPEFNPAPAGVWPPPPRVP